MYLDCLGFWGGIVSAICEVNKATSVIVSTG